MDPVVDVSIVIVTYECRELVRACLRAIRPAVGDLTHEIIVADNASTDGVVTMLRAEWPTVSIIEMGSNTGFARANNRAIASSQGRWILLLNPDTEAAPGSIAEMAHFMGSRRDVGVVAPQLLNTDLTDQGTARSFPTAAAAFFGRRSLMTRLFPKNRISRRYMSGREVGGLDPFEVDWVSGAALMVDRDVISRVGGLDEGFFMHWEDADWCYRVKAAGLKVFCVPAARIIHHEGGSRRGWPPRQIWAFHHGAFRFYSKHHASSIWNPLRYVAALGLGTRAIGLLAVWLLRPHAPRGRPAQSLKGVR